MKTVILTVLVVLGISSAVGKEAEAFPGMICFNASGCGRCEVCVKPEPYAASGICMQIEGCH